MDQPKQPRLILSMLAYCLQDIYARIAQGDPTMTQPFVDYPEPE